MGVTAAPAPPTSVIAGRSPIQAATFDRLMTASCAWLVIGLFVDGWAHYHLTSASETFFTPWHALLYSGCAACVALLGWAVLEGRKNGLPIARAVPAGYEAALIGGGILAVAGVADMLWHVFAGIETDIATQLSPTHVLLAIGIVLIVSGPFRAAAWRVPPPPPRVGAQLPSLISLGLVLAVAWLFVKAFHPYYIPWGAGVWRPSHEFGTALNVHLTYLQEALGLAGFIIMPAIVMGILLIALRGGLLPPGGATFILAASTALFDVAFLPVSIVGGIAADLMLWRLRPLERRSVELRAFAALVPVVISTAYYVEVYVTRGGIWWPIHLWAGSILIAGLTGLVMSYLIFPNAVTSMPEQSRSVPAAPSGYTTKAP